MHIHDYATASDYLGKKTERPLTGRATRMFRRDDETIAIRYQATDVITYHANGTITLNSGGWKTVTTKARISEYTRARVYADKGQWFIAIGSGHAWDTPRSKRPLYYDGMIVDAHGKPRELRYETATDSEIKRQLDRKVSRYIKAYAAEVTANGIQRPGNGDCWGCLMQVVDAPTVTQGPMRLQGKPTPHGRIEPMGVDHYLQHFDESYFVPSLLANAIKARGYRDPGFIWAIIERNKDGRMVADILRGYFRNLKPALLDYLKTQAA